MELRITFETFDPPTGRAVADDEEAWQFVGWLELMQRLEDYAAAYPERPPTDTVQGLKGTHS